ncbi:MAG: hypothetical protein LBD55_00245 [Treponema sp.]|nr:hypothetical protein [Treponema sp.]
MFEGEQDRRGGQEKTERAAGLDMSLQDFYVDNLGNSPEYRRVLGNNPPAGRGEAAAMGNESETALEKPA